MASFATFGNELYTGERSIDFVGRQKIWYTISGVAHRCSSLIGLLRPRAQPRRSSSRAARSSRVSNAQTTNDVIGRDAVQSVDPTADAQVTKVGTDSVRVQTSKLKNDSKNEAVVAALAKAYGVSEDQVSLDLHRAQLGRGHLQEGPAGPDRLPDPGLPASSRSTSAPGRWPWPRSSRCCTTC